MTSMPLRILDFEGRATVSTQIDYLIAFYLALNHTTYQRLKVIVDRIILKNRQIKLRQ